MSFSIDYIQLSFYLCFLFYLLRMCYFGSVVVSVYYLSIYFLVNLVEFDLMEVIMMLSLIHI